MRVAVVGAGAMGSLFGALLAPVAPVVLVDSWKEHIAAIREHGLQLSGVSGDRTVTVQATDDPSGVGPVDLVIVFVKSSQTAWAAGLARCLLAPRGLALTLQNGLGNAEILESVIGPECTGIGVTAAGATLLGPGRVRYAGKGATYLAAGPANGDKIEAVAELFAGAGLDAQVSDSLDALIWGKLVVNAGINALTALLRVPNGLLAETGPLCELMEAAAAEAAAVARAKGITLPYADPKARVREVAESTGANWSSMLQDALRGAPTEVAAINGAVVREGLRAGVPTPVNALLLRLIEGMEASYGQRVP